MDIHRCRFVPYPTSAINAVAFSSHQTTKKKSSSIARLAIGRANGDIEIWNPLGGQWHQETILHGGRDRSIDGLVWVTEPDQTLPDGRVLPGKLRLFSIGYTSTVTEWDLEKRRPKKQATGMHKDIWCLGAQPFYDSKTSKKAKAGPDATPPTAKLVAGTIDGSLALYSIEDGDLRFDRVLVKAASKKTRMVSMCFQSRNVVVVGCADSSIRAYDMRNGNLIRKMTLGSDLAGGAKEIIVWSVKCLEDGDIVSGDSTGQVCIWDGKTYTQAQRLKSHKQDVLSLAVSADGSTIVSGGMDRRTVLYRKTTGSSVRWASVWHRRYHSHDVKTMSSFEGAGISVVVSGGPDANPVVLPLREAGMENHRSLSHLPQTPPLQSAPRARLVVGWWDREVHIWRLQRPLKDIVNASGVDAEVSKNRKLLARILVKGEANITSASISSDGSLLVVATASDVKVFHLQPKSEAKKDELKITKVDVPEKVSALGATGVKISPDGQWVCLVQEGSRVVLVKVLPGSDETEGQPTIDARPIKLNRVKRDIPKHTAFSGLGQYDRSITQIAFSPDTKMLAVADMQGFVDTWIRGSHPGVEVDGSAEDESDDSDSDSEEETSKAPKEWTRNPNASLLPKLRNSPTLLSFSDHLPSEGQTRPENSDLANDYLLLAATAKPQILLLHPLSGHIASWSRRNPTERLPLEFRNIRDLVKGALWSGDRVWLYGNTFVFMFDISQDIAEDTPDASTALVSLDEQGRPRKRKRGKDTGAGNKMQMGALGPTKVERYADGQAEELDVDRRAADAMDTDEQSQPGDDSDGDESDVEPRGSSSELAIRRKADLQQAGGTQQTTALGFWHTHKYRPILGIVPLESPSDEPEGGGEDNENAAPVVAAGPARKTLEVALVERPLWEADTPERYMGEGELDR